MLNPTYTVQHATSPITLSGKIDDPQWQRAEVAALTSVLDGSPMRFTTNVRALYDDRYFYLAYYCEDDYVWSTLTEREAHVWTQECVEAFICPSGKMRLYYEINVNPNNAVFDTLCLNLTPALDELASFRSYINYDCDDLITRVFVDGEIGVPGGAQCWSAEYAIPHTSIIGADNLIPQPGDTWKANFFRIDAPLGPGRSLDDSEYYAWGTIGKNDFHQPFGFGTLVFA